MGTGLTKLEILRNLGMNVKVGPKLSIDDGINAGRVMLDKCKIDQYQCEELIEELTTYRYTIIKKNGKASKFPEHNDAADAFRYCAISLKEMQPKKPLNMNAYRPLPMPQGPGAWLAL